MTNPAYKISFAIRIGVIGSGRIIGPARRGLAWQRPPGPGFHHPNSWTNEKRL